MMLMSPANGRTNRDVDWGPRNHVSNVGPDPPTTITASFETYLWRPMQLDILNAICKEHAAGIFHCARIQWKTRGLFSWEISIRVRSVSRYTEPYLQGAAAVWPLAATDAGTCLLCD